MNQRPMAFAENLEKENVSIFSFSQTEIGSNGAPSVVDGVTGPG